MEMESHFDKGSIEPCPVLRPSMEEFSNPLPYLSRPDIAQLGKEYGLIKLIPPEGWNPTFLISPEFRFHTRIQKLSELSLVTRSRKFFIDGINRFQKMKGRPLLKLHFRVGPSDVLDDKNKHPYRKSKIHYYDVYTQVEKHGGPLLIDSASWEKINDHFGLKKGSTVLKEIYQNRLKSYAVFLLQNQDDFSFPETDSEDDGDNCVVCGSNDRPTRTLLCDNCDSAHHMDCLDPPLERIPDGNWYCQKCLIGTGDYGFEEQTEIKYSLEEFRAMCEEFQRNFIQQHNGGNQLTVDVIEKKFWEQVGSQNSDIEVRYGADIHNLKPGEISGFPMKDSVGIDLNNPKIQYYINHPWNLNRLPYAEGSLLNLIQTSIPGMTIPWIYIGSLFSTFCWHVEDHYTLSANYCHLGATKKWYGIPSKDADRFEELMKESAPDLFKKQPDLLHQLVTLFSPMELSKHGIKCVYADQNPNEFVITYPRVYHAGFNCGFNFNEAVNFTMQSWLDFGESSISDYRLIRKENVFDHYKLVENILHKIWNGGHPEDVDTEFLAKCIKLFEDFINEQARLLNQVDHSKFIERFVPHETSINGIQVKKENNDEDVDEELCDLCRASVSYLHCIINNSERNFFEMCERDPGHYKRKYLPPARIVILQLLTPESSPQSCIIRSGTDSNKALRLSKTESSLLLSTFHDDSPATWNIDSKSLAAKCESSARSSLPPAKRLKLDSDLSCITVTQPQSSQSGKMRAIARRTSLSILDQNPSIRLCLPCLISTCRSNFDSIPPDSLLIVRTNIHLLRTFVGQLKTRLLSTSLSISSRAPV